MSLKAFHLLFILLVIIGADVLGAWFIWGYADTRDVMQLALGATLVVGGLGLIVYVWRLVRSFERDRIG